MCSKQPQNQVKTSGCFIHRKVHLEVITIQEENDSGLNECGYRKMNFKVIFTILGKNGKWTGCRVKEVDVGLRV